MNPTPQRGLRLAAILPGMLAACAVVLLGGCVVAPSKNLVVVRMGVTQDFSNSDYGVARLVSDVIAAIGDGS